MAEGGKSLKFQFILDSTSFQQVKRALNELLAVSQQLSKTLSGVSLPGQGAGSGLLGGGTIGGPVTAAGGGGGQTRTAAAQNPIAKVVLENANAFKSLAASGSSSLKGLTDALKRSVGDQQREVDILKRSLAGLESMYESVSKKAAAGDLRAVSAAKGLQDRMVSRAGKLATAEERLQKLSALEPPDAGEQSGFLARAKTAYKTGGVAGVLGMPVGGGPPGATAAGTMLRGMGFGPGMMGAAGLGMAGLWGLKNIENQLANAPMFQAQFEASRGQQAAGVILPLLQGDVRREMARTDIFRDSEKYKDYKNVDNVLTRLKSNVGAFFTGNFGTAFSGEAGEAAVKRRREEMVGLEQEANPLLQTVRGQMQDYRSNLSRMRALGIGARADESGYQRLQEWHAASGLQAYSQEEIAAARQSIQAAGTRQASYKLMGGVLSAQAGGLTSASDIAGTMSKFGVSIGRGFLDAVRVSGRGGGLDVQTANDLGSFVARQQSQFGIATGAGQGLGMLGMLSGGAQGEQGRIIAEQNMRGVGALQQVMAGNIDPYQKARNLQIAIGTGARGIYAQDYLAGGMSLANLSDLAAGKTELTSMEKAMGVTKEQKLGTMKGVLSTPLERIIQDPEMAGTGMMGFAELLRSNEEDLPGFFKKLRTGKVKGYEGKVGMEKAVGEFGSILYAGGLAGEGPEAQAAAMGAARNVMNLGRLAPTEGRKISDPAGASADIKMAADHIKTLGTVANQAAGEVANMTRAFSTMYFTLQAQEQARKMPAGEGAEYLRLQTEAINQAAVRGTLNKGAIDDLYNELKTAGRPKPLTQSQETRRAQRITGSKI